ncbi:hypothetical protein [Clostridium sp. AM58-1XD]|uniref:hypothetical protein n=1 Tax=Clostridium sp. AM58-1XD TaxID=2292307 RepID=UPI000E5543B0|nr:hypothetical protein [Clostridium sp. AM58-1XD]RGY96099.1 hypothetical protein DXA13_17880 [Clostridium sp. AM58-1XD]
MLNEDKIQLMTGIAMFEKKEGKDMFPAESMFKSDYVGSHMLKAFFRFTCSFLIGFVVWGLYSIEELLNMITVEHLVRMGIQGAILYGFGLFVYLWITYTIYSKRYDNAGRAIRVYKAKLRRLHKRYEFRTKTRELTGKGGRTS